MVTYHNIGRREDIPIKLLSGFCSGIAELFGELAKTEPHFATRASNELTPKQLLALLTCDGLGAIALADKKVVGAVVLKPLSLGEYELMVGVSASHRKQGIATRLLEFITDEVKDNNGRLICLMVSEENIEAVSLYQKSDFHIIGKAKRNIFADNRDVSVLFMEKRLREKH